MERFWEKVDKSGDCWEWIASCDRGGYGQFSVGFKKYRAHRFAWELVNGPITTGMCVCHTCDNRKCVRIDHLFLGTFAENLKDMVDKGRSNVGVRHWNSKLTDVQTVEIRDSDQTCRQLAKDFGVSFQTVSKIKNEKRWGHLCAS